MAEQWLDKGYDPSAGPRRDRISTGLLEVLEVVASEALCPADRGTMIR